MVVEIREIVFNQDGYFSSVTILNLEMRMRMGKKEQKARVEEEHGK